MEAEEHCAGEFEDIVVCRDMVALNWYPTNNHKFYEPKKEDNIKRLKEWLHRQENGFCFPVRGRDWVSVNDFSQWDYGVATKNSERLFFLYESGCVESFRIDCLNFRDLVHFTLQDNIHNGLNAIKSDSRKVMIISHGWSEEVGPDYPLIRTLEHVAVRAGWKVIVPDFRSTYRFPSQRGRAERVRVIYEELLCLDPKPDCVVLVGHSQGGAASALASSDRVIKHSNIQGLLLFGSENPRDLDGMDWIPKFPKGKAVIVHATGDLVVSLSELEHTAELWNFEFIRLTSTVETGQRDCWGDDINHDFTAKDLMQSAVSILQTFLEQY